MSTSNLFLVTWWINSCEKMKNERNGSDTNDEMHHSNQLNYLQKPKKNKSLQKKMLRDPCGKGVCA